MRLNLDASAGARLMSDPDGFLTIVARQRLDHACLEVPIR